MTCELLAEIGTMARISTLLASCSAKNMTFIANKKAARQRDGLFFQGRIVPTEVQKTIRTFYKNLMGRGKAVSRNFSRISTFIFNNLAKQLTASQ
jgi:hypothetical protein